MSTLVLMEQKACRTVRTSTNADWVTELPFIIGVTLRRKVSRQRQTVTLPESRAFLFIKERDRPQWEKNWTGFKHGQFITRETSLKDKCLLSWFVSAASWAGHWPLQKLLVQRPLPKPQLISVLAGGILSGLHERQTGQNWNSGFSSRHQQRPHADTTCTVLPQSSFYHAEAWKPKKQTHL